MLSMSEWILTFVVVFCFEHSVSFAQKDNAVINPADTYTKNYADQILNKEEIENVLHLSFKANKREDQNLSNNYSIGTGTFRLRKGTSSKLGTKQEIQWVSVEPDATLVDETLQHLAKRAGPSYHKTVTPNTRSPGKSTIPTPYDQDSVEATTFPKGTTSYKKEPSQLMREEAIDWDDIPGSTTYVVSPTKYEVPSKERPASLDNILNTAQKGSTFNPEESTQNPQPVTWVKTTQTGRPEKGVEETTQSSPSLQKPTIHKTETGQPGQWTDGERTERSGKWVEETTLGSPSRQKTKKHKTETGQPGKRTEETHTMTNSVVEGEESEEESGEDDGKKGKESPPTYSKEWETSSFKGDSPPSAGKIKQNSGSGSNSISSWCKESVAKGALSPARGDLLAIKHKRVIQIHGKRAGRSASRRRRRIAFAKRKRNASGKRSAARSRSFRRGSRSRSFSARGGRFS